MMKYLNGGVGRISDDAAVQLEIQLATALKPRPPRTEFVSSLQNKLYARDIQVAAPLPSANISRVMLVTGGILGSALMLIASIFGLISLIRLIGQRFYKNSQEERTLTV